MKIFSNQAGVSAIAAALTLLILAALGAVLTYLVAAGSVGRMNHLSAAQAFYVTQAGIEYAVKKVYEGENEIVPPPGINFGEGSFTVSRSGPTLTITGTVGEAERVHSVDSPTEADCTVIDTNNTNLTKGDKRIGGVSFRKICLAQITIKQMQLSWIPDNGERLEEIKIEEDIIYTNPLGAPSGTLLEVTDVVITSPNSNTINWFEFDLSMEDKEVTLTFIMGDDTTKTAVFETED